MKRAWKLLAAVLAFAAVAAVAGVAYAVLGSTGAGSGVASTGDMDTVTIESAVGVVVDATLYPGGTADVVLKVNNPNAYAVEVVSILLTDGGEITGADGIGDCDTTGVTYTPPAGVDDIAPGDSTITLEDAVAMDLTADNGCQGATFQIPVTLRVKA